MTDNETAQRGRDASLVLENPAYIEAMQLMRVQVVEQLHDCPVRDVDGQLLLVQLLKMAGKFEGLMAGIVERGRMAQTKIDLSALRKESGASRFMRKVTG